MTDNRDHMNQDLTISAGDDVNIVTLVKDANGDAVNVNGFAPEFGLFRASDGRRLITKTDGAGVSVTDAVAGEITATLDAADTQSLAGEFFHETDVVDLQSKRATVSGGKLTIISKRT